MTMFIREQFRKVLDIVTQIESDTTLIQKINQAALVCIQALHQRRKILLAGNGGSASDAQHLAAEIVGRLRFNRPALPAIALTTDTSILTAVANDNGFEEIFARQVEGLGQEQDVFIAITTSGKSPNVLKAIQAARTKKLKIIGFTGANAPWLNDQCDVVINIPSTETSKIQECHIMVGHILCEMIETHFFHAFDPNPQKETLELSGQFS